MGNGRRLGGGGGGGGGGRNQRVLRQRIESCKSKYPTADDIVPYLRERYSDYRRMEQRALMRLVNNILHNSASPQPSKRPPPVPASSYDEETAPSQRRQQKRARDEEDEKRLQRIEKEHSRRRFSKNQWDSGADTESESESESESGPSSTSEDGVYGERVEPEFDLFRSMLRDSYAGETKEKNMELEIASANFKEENKMEMPMTGDGGKGEVGGGGEGLRKGKEKDCGAGVEVGQGKEVWPRFRDLGGIREVLEELEVEVFVPLYHPHVLQRLGVNPVSGILLHGPPGCGKTKLAHAIANETGVPFYRISAPEVVSGVSGSSEENIRNLFSKAYRTAPSIIFIDEIDSIASKRDNVQKDMERRIVTQLMTCMDEFHKLQKSSNGISDSEDYDQSPGFVLVIGATNRPDAIDPALRRPGRFDREIKLSVPDENARVEILKVLTRRYTLDGSLDLLQIARATPGFVGADLVALVNKAGYLAMRRILSQRKSELSRDYADKERNEYWWKVPWLPEEIEKLAITMADFEKAVKAVQPSSKREGFSDIPDVNWGDVGGLDSIRKEFDLHIVRPIKCPELYKKFGVKLETGILLYGPPGCGKTLIAKAAANEAGANFITIKGPELLNKYVGESELAVRTLFNRARTCSPCVLFFDEVDALTTKRGKEGGWVVERLLNQLLIELDGADQRSGVFVIGATNRPEVIDPAVLRPGRFGKLLYVPLPSSDDRGLILKALAKKEKPIDPSVDLSAIGQMKACESFSGADLKNLMNEAALVAMEDAHRDGNSDDTLHTIKAIHFEQALGKISPSVSQEQVEFYKIWSENFRSG